MEFLISVSVLGTTYALLAAGIVIVYKASRVVNFAHGELAIVGAYGFYSAGLMSIGPGVTGPALLVPIAITAGASILFGVAVYVALMRRLLGQPTFVARMSSATKPSTSPVWTSMRGPTHKRRCPSGAGASPYQASVP